MKKISSHELGHNIGLEHFKTPACVMQDEAEAIKTIDKVNPVLCNACNSKMLIPYYALELRYEDQYAPPAVDCPS